MGRWNRIEWEGYAAWMGQTGSISLVVIPELGSKVISLKNQKTGREWLWRSGKPLGNQGYDSSFASGDESGWDEMFPSINECTYPNEPWKGLWIPDHGELWSLTWQTHDTVQDLQCRVEGAKLPYTLEKIYSFASENKLRIDYTLMNRSNSLLYFLWAAHPLFQSREGMKLQLPPELTDMEISYTHGGCLGQFLEKKPWPIVQTQSGMKDLSVIGPEDGVSADKYFFTGKLETGYAGLFDPSTGERLWLRFPADQVPYLAIWVNHGGYGGHYHVAIEPATAKKDALDLAIRANEVANVGPQAQYHWYLEIEIT